MTFAAIAAATAVAGVGLGAYSAANSGGGPSNSGGAPNTATGGQSANLLSGASMMQGGNQYLQDAMGLQGYGQGYASQFFPQVQQATQNAAYNPYGGQAIGGAQQAYNYGTNYLAPYQSGGASQLGGLASLYQPYASQALGQGFSPTAGSAYENQYLQQAATPTAGAGYAGQALQQAFSQPVGQQYLDQALGQAFGSTVSPQYLQQALSQYGTPLVGQNYINQSLNQATSPLIGQQYTDQALSQISNPLVGSQYTNQALQQAFAPTAGGQYAAQALATGFSPNNGLYNQQLQQTQDQSNAINAMYGLGSSPYGANLTDQATQNFNNAFNLNQAQLQGQAANTYDSLMNQQLATQGQGLNAYGQFTNANLANQAQGLSQLGTIGNLNLANQAQGASNFGAFNNANFNNQQQGLNAFGAFNNANLAGQQQGLNAFTGLSNQNLANQAQGANIYGNLMNTQLANQTGNLNAYNSLADTQLASQLGLAGLGSTLGGQAGTLYGQGGALGQGAFNTYSQAGGLPAAAYQGLSNNSLAAFGTGAQNANATLNPYTTYLNSLGNILGLGQVGQQNAAQQAQAGFGQGQTVGNNLGQSLAQLGGSGSGSLQSLWNLINGTGSSGSYSSNADPYATPTSYYDTYGTSTFGT